MRTFMGQSERRNRVSTRATSWGLLCAVSLAFAWGPIGAQDPLIPLQSDGWTYLKGTEEPPVGWKDLDFDDRDWTEAQLPIGYSTDLAYNTVLSDMQQAGANPGYASVYLRKLFTVDFPDEVKSLQFTVNYDDGFVAYLNGVEILRQSIGGNPGTAVPYNTFASSHESTPAVTLYVWPACDPGITLEKGENVLAVQVHNTNLTSSDCTFEVRVVSGTVDPCPTNLQATLSSGGDTVRLAWGRPTGVTFESLTVFRNGKEVESGPASVASLSWLDRAPEAGRNDYELVATGCAGECVLSASIDVTPPGSPFRRGDADDSGGASLTDAVYILLHLFQGGPEPTCMDAADCDDDGQVNVTDPVFLLNALFLGATQPPEPGTASCGEDPSGDDDGLTGCVYTSC